MLLLRMDENFCSFHPLTPEAEKKEKLRYYFYTLPPCSTDVREREKERERKRGWKDATDVVKTCTTACLTSYILQPASPDC